MNTSTAKAIAAKATQTVVPFPRRQWSAAKVTALNSDWPVYQRPIDVDVRHAITAIRARARELAQNADHARGFLRIARNNLVGKPGFALQSRAQLRNGKPDQRTREAIETAWNGWGKRGTCEISGKFSWRGLQRHIVETVVRDGEALLRKLAADNPYGFTLQVIDPAVLDETYNGVYSGNQVRMGVELDDFRRPIAYHLNGEPPITSGSYRVGGDRYRVPAEEIIHVYLPEFAWQTRAVSWLAVGAGRMHMITGTEDAEVTASRASAAKFAAYEAKEWADAPQPVQTPGLVDAYGRPLSSDPGQFAQDLSPGTMEVVPYGYELKLLDPQHPNAAMPDFLKWALRSVATGWGCAYNTLGNDAEGVNYTSLRFFLGIERDNWMELQDWLQADLIEPVFDHWAETQLLLGTLPIRPGASAELYRNHWQPRRWEGPDPKKQSDADEKDLSIGSTSLHEIFARKGRDFEDQIAERVAELKTIKEAAEAAGLTLQDVLPMLAKSAAAPAAKPTEAPDAEDDD